MTLGSSIAALVERTRERRRRELSDRESLTLGLLSVSFLVAALAIGLLIPWNRDADPVLLAGLVALVALFYGVQFEVGTGSATPTQLVFLPLLFLAPLPLVPLLLVLGLLLERLRAVVTGAEHVSRWLWALPSGWSAVGPVLVVAALAAGEPKLELAWVYALAALVQVVTGSVPFMIGEALNGHAWRDSARSIIIAQLVDVLFSPVGLALVFASWALGPFALALLGPLGLLLVAFSRSHNNYWRQTAVAHEERWERAVADQRQAVLATNRWANGSSPAPHWRCVLELAPAVAANLGRSARFADELAFVARVHDLGKRHLPRRILAKPGPLREEEWRLLREHPVIGQTLLRRVRRLIEARLASASGRGRAAACDPQLDFFERAGRVVRSTHENFDGTGYPDRLAGDDIPLAARIIACCDAYSSMTAPRPYREAMSKEIALEEIRRAAGSEFDPKVCAALERVLADPAPAAQWQPAYQPLRWPAAVARQLAGAR